MNQTVDLGNSYTHKNKLFSQKTMIRTIISCTFAILGHWNTLVFLPLNGTNKMTTKHKFGLIKPLNLFTFGFSLPHIF